MDVPTSTDGAALRRAVRLVVLLNLGYFECVPPFTRGVLGGELDLVLGRELSPLVQEHSMTLSSPPHIPG